MFSFYHHNKLRYNKGQIAPFFIVIIVTVIILALVSINIGKISFIRTDSTNAVDSGAISGGAVMANLFNVISAQNFIMYTDYWTFFTTVSISFIIALVELGVAYGAAIAGEVEAIAALALGEIAENLACAECCSAEGPAYAAVAAMGAAIASIGTAITAISLYNTTMISILTTVIAYHVASQEFYRLIRSNGREGRRNAIATAHRYAFTNAGITEKLIQGPPPLELVINALRARDFTTAFEIFLENSAYTGIDKNYPRNHYMYDWQDGQIRYHRVDTWVDIEKMDTYDLQVAVNPFPTEVALLIYIIIEGYTAVTELGIAEVEYILAESMYLSGASCLSGVCACSLSPYMDCDSCGCDACESLLSIGNTAAELGISSNSTAISTMSPLFALTTTAWASLLPGWIYRSHSDYDAYWLIICWIDDIIHDRKVRVDIRQFHQGADLTLWRTSYPVITSYCIVDFEGDGHIYPYAPYHDASIVEVDDIPGI